MQSMLTLYDIASMVVDAAREKYDGIWKVSEARERMFNEEAKWTLETIDRRMNCPGIAKVNVAPHDYCQTLLVSVEYAADEFHITPDDESLLNDGVLIDIAPAAAEENDSKPGLKVTFSIMGIWEDKAEV